MKYIIYAVLLVLTGCSSVLPSEKIEHSDITDFNHVKEKYDSIIPYESSYTDLITMDFDPYNSNNVIIVTYTDVMSKFMPENITVEDLSPGVRDCIVRKEECLAFKIEYSRKNRERIGNVTADVFGFVKETETTGWTFNAFFIVVDDTVVYKLFSGEPKHYEYRKSVKPLGPLQSLDIVVGKVI